MRELNESSSRELGLRFAELSFPATASFDHVTALIRKSGVQLLVVVDDVYRLPWMDQLLPHLEAIRVPALYLFPAIVRRRGLVSLSPDFQEGEREAIRIVTRILAGEDPAALPIYEVTRYRTTLNLRTARAMGLEIPASVLIRADETIN